MAVEHTHTHIYIYTHTYKWVFDGNYHSFSWKIHQKSSPSHRIVQSCSWLPGEVAGWSGASWRLAPNRWRKEPRRDGTVIFRDIFRVGLEIIYIYIWVMSRDVAKSRCGIHSLSISPNMPEWNHGLIRGISSFRRGCESYSGPWIHHGFWWEELG